MQRLGAPLVDLVLRIEHVAHQAVAVVFPVAVGRHENERAFAFTVLVHIRAFTRIELRALDELAPLPDRILAIPHQDHANARAALVKPNVARPVVVCVFIDAVGRCQGVILARIFALKVVPVHPQNRALVARIRKVALAAVRIVKQAVPRIGVDLNIDLAAPVDIMHHLAAAEAFHKEVIVDL